MNHINNKDQYNVPFEMDIITPPTYPSLRVYVTGEDNGKAIQRAIHTCHSNGGGTVVIPKGLWRSQGPIHLYSNMCLSLEKDAIVEFSSEPEDYLPVVFTRWEGIECYNYSPLIYANGCENIGIIGEGILKGGGAPWWHWKKLQGAAAKELYHAQSNGIPVSERVYGTKDSALRPSFIQPIHCKNVHIQGITIEDGPQWMVHPVYCENILIQNIKVLSNGHNTDGLNPDSCTNVLIEDSLFSTGDDCIAINSGMNEDGWRVNKPCKNIIIRNCTMLDGHGAIVIGSGMSGGVENVYAHKITVTGGMWGIRMKSMRGRGGYVRNIWMEDMDISNVAHTAVHVSMFYEYTTVDPVDITPSDFNHIWIKNIRGKNNNDTVMIRGLPEKNLDSITLDNISFEPCTNMSISDVTNLKIIQP